MREARHVLSTLTGLAVTLLFAGPAAVADEALSASSLWESSVSLERSSLGGSETRVQWTGADGERIEMRARGSIELAPDDRDVVGVGRQGFFALEAGRGPGRRRIEIRAGRNGELERSWFVAGERRVYGEVASRWLAERLPQVIRESGLGAPRRVARILADAGVDGVLDEIERISGSWAQKRYFELLFERAELDAQQQVRALGRIERGMRSDHEKAELLGRPGWLALGEPRVRNGFLAAASTLRSDYEARRALGALLASGRQPAAAVDSILELAGGIDSDYEKATLLVELTAHDLAAASVGRCVELARTIGSGYERRRALSALLAVAEPSPEELELVVRAAAGIDSDHEKATLLVEIARGRALAGRGVTAYLEAAESVGSAYERKRVLVGLLDATRLGEDDLAKLLEVAAGVGSAYEKATLLARVAEEGPLRGEAAAAYLRAAASVGSSYETQRALAPFFESSRLEPRMARAALDLLGRMGGPGAGLLLEALAPSVAGDSDLEARYRVAAEDLRSDSAYRSAIRALERSRAAGGSS